MTVKATELGKNLFREACDCLMLTDPAAKAVAVRALQNSCRQEGFFLDAELDTLEIRTPGRPEKPELVAPVKVPRRRLGSEAGRVALIHAVTHIEFNAINLALDAIYRFRAMPESYYLDWLSVAADESRHFQMLNSRLADMGHSYGDFPAHNGLWQMAVKTGHDCMVRMALVPRVLEARGLDVTPGMIERLEAAGDSESCSILGTILEEEIRHVEIGSRWFAWWCSRRGLDPGPTFVRLLQQYYGGAIRGPFNHEARLAAGFSAAELETLEALGDRPG